MTTFYFEMDGLVKGKGKIKAESINEALTMINKKSPPAHWDTSKIRFDGVTKIGSKIVRVKHET